MKRLIIVGAGQFGRSAASLLDPDRRRVLAFGDNDPGAWDRTCAPPVLPLEEALALEPDEVMLAVKGEDRAVSLREQLRSLGWQGEIDSFCEKIDGFSLRGALLRRTAARLRALPVAGAAAELGVYRGDFAWQINAALPDRTLYLFDTFRGFPQESLEREGAELPPAAKRLDFSGVRVGDVLRRMPHPERVIVREGVFPETAAGVEEAFCFVSLDADLYQPTLDGLRYFYPRLSPGGVIFLHDHESGQYPGVRAAVREYEQERGALSLLPLCDPHGTAIVIKPFQDGVMQRV